MNVLIALLSILTTCESFDGVLQSKKRKICENQTHLHLLMVTNGM